MGRREVAPLRGPFARDWLTHHSPAETAPKPAEQAAPQVRLINRVLPSEDIKLFAPEGSAEGCASGECLPEAATQRPAHSTQHAAPATQHAAPATQRLAPRDAPSRPPTAAATPHAPFATQPAPATQQASPIELHENDEPEPPPAVAAQPRAPASDADRWARAVDQLRQSSPRHGKALTYARFLGFVPEGVKIAFPPDAAFHRAQVTGMGRAMVEAELSRSLGRAIKVLEDTSAEALQAAPKSIAEVEATDRNSRERGIEAKVKSHPALRSVLKHLGGSLEHIAYLEPVDRPPRPASAPEETDSTTPQAD